MPRQQRIWSILGIGWWWICLLSFVEGALRLRYHAPEWLPSLTEGWILLQVVWLKLAMPKSKTLYLVLFVGVLQIVSLLDAHWASFVRVPIELTVGFGPVVAIFLFRSELQEYFEQVDSRGLVLSGFMTFFFSYLYFQYWFHEMYRYQDEYMLPPTPSPA